MRATIIIFLIVTFSKTHAQTLGGNTAYNFLKLSYATGVTAAGGVNISYAPDVSVGLDNPALLNPKFHAQAGLNFTNFIAGINGYQLGGAYFDNKRNTTFGGKVIFLNYGQIQATDAAGNLLGQFRPNDYLVQLSAGRQYLEKWHYGVSLKFIHSSYSLYQSAALAVDIGLNYFDSTNGLSLSAIVKNMGAQLKTYAGESEDLPFDLEFGITKKLAKAPFAFSLTLLQVHHFNLFYNDPRFSDETNTSNAGSFFTKASQHIVVATHIFISKQLEATIGYNQLRRSELSLGTVGNGLAGFSAGLAARFEKLQISYARSTYQRGINYNQFGLNLKLNKLLGEKF